MEQFLRKSQNSGKITWTRVKRSNGKYGYVRTKNRRPVDFDEYTGKFKMYDLPDTNSNWLEVSKMGASLGKIKSIERKPDSHADYMAQQKLVDEHVKSVTPTAEDLFTIGTLGGLNNLSPTQWARRAYDLGEAIKGNMSWDNFVNNWFYGNNGLVSDEYAQEHPYASAAINFTGDAAAFGALSTLRKLPKYATLMEAENRAAQEASALNWRDMFTNSTRRTRVGDVEVDNPGLYYHQSDAGKANNFVSTNRMRTPLEESWLAKEEAGEKIPLVIRSGIKPGYPQDPGSAMFAQGRLWYGLTPNKPDLLVTAREMPIANKNASIMSDKASLKALYEQGSRRVTNDNIYTQGPHNTQNTSAYTWEPGYGYRKVLAEETPTVEWADAASTPQTTAENATSITPKQWTAKGLGNISNTLKGTSGYKNWRLAREANLAIKGKPNISITADAGTTANQGSTALSLEEILKAFNQARQWHLNRINSPGYTQRALRAGFTEEEIPQLLLLLTGLINRLKLLTPEELFGTNFQANHNLNGKASAGYWRANLNGNLVQGISFYLPHMSYDDAVSTFVHEFGHGATFGLNGNETTGYMKLLSDLFPLLTRAVKYNKTLYPEVNENIVTQVMPKVGNNAGYYAAPTEMLSRGYEFMRDYANNFFKLKNSEGLTTQRVIDNAANTRINSKIFRALTGNLGAFNFLKYALGTSIPVGLGYSLINNNDNLEQQLQSLKQGGKMNTVEQFKNGSKIHIKKKNRGKFTDYCGGEVTQECIRKAKASGNPTLVKRATFADNARKWKHKEGGKAFVKGVNVLDSNPRIYKYLTKIKVSPRGVVKKETGGSFVNNALNFINSDTGQSIIGGVSNIIQGMSAKKKLNKAIDALKKAIDELYNVAKNNIDMGARKSLAQANLEYKKALSPGIHFGEIDLGLEENKLKLEAAAKATNDANALRDQALANLNNQASLMSNEASNNITGNIGGLLNGAFQLAGNYFSNKTSNNTVKPGYTYSKITSNNFSTPKTNFSVNMKL